jgi:uncharacterized membrane protein YbhN (UPF0104 family)
MTSRFKWLWLVAWLIATALLIGFYRPMDWRETAAYLQTTHWGWFLVAIVLNGLILVTWTRLWRRLVPFDATIARREMGGIVALVAAGLNTLPFFGGHVVGAGLLVSRGQLSGGALATLLVIDQIFEGAAKLCLLSLAMMAAPLPDWMQGVTTSIACVVLIATPVIAWIATREAAHVPSWLARWTEHFRLIRRPRDWAAGLGWSLAAKGAEAAAILAVQQAFGVTLPLESVIVVLAAVNMATLVSIAPGNLGVYEAAAYAIYLSLGVPPEQAVALALVQHAAYLIAMIGPGYIHTGWRVFNNSRTST